MKITEKKKRTAYDLEAIEASLNAFILGEKSNGLDFSEEAEAFKKSGLGNMAARKRFWKAVEIKRKEKSA